MARQNHSAAPGGAARLVSGALMWQALPRHLAWRGSATPPSMARQCRALPLGAARAGSDPRAGSHPPPSLSPSDLSPSAPFFLH